MIRNKKVKIPVKAPEKAQKNAPGKTGKKQYPENVLEQMPVNRELAEKIVDLVLGEYEMSALNFKEVLALAQTTGLKRFRL